MCVCSLIRADICHLTRMDVTQHDVPCLQAIHIHAWPRTRNFLGNQLFNDVSASFCVSAHHTAPEQNNFLREHII